jgi:cytochrome c-type biogenesis protein CcmH
MKKRTFNIALLLSVLALLVVAGAAFAQEQTPLPPSDNDVNNIAQQMYCPVCENIPLDVCDTKACEQWRELIREKLSAGWDEDRIKEYFVLQYGDRVLAEPPRRGLNWLVYILPLVFFMGGLYILYRVLRRMRPAAPAARPEGEDLPEPKDSYVARVEEALRERRK